MENAPDTVSVTLQAIIRTRAATLGVELDNISPVFVEHLADILYTIALKPTSHLDLDPSAQEMLRKLSLVSIAPPRTIEQPSATVLRVDLDDIELSMLRANSTNEGRTFHGALQRGRRYTLTRRGDRPEDRTGVQSPHWAASSKARWQAHIASNVDTSTDFLNAFLNALGPPPEPTDSEHEETGPFTPVGSR
jgi:hypothetical protein